MNRESKLNKNGEGTYARPVHHGEIVHGAKMIPVLISDKLVEENLANPEKIKLARKLPQKKNNA